MTTHSQSLPPVSWFALERYQLGELSPAEKSRVESHLAGCSDCADCMAKILHDPIVLPPLPAVSAQVTGWSVPESFWWWIRRPGSLAAAASALVLVAAVAAWMTFRNAAPVPAPAFPAATAVFKGGEWSISLVRNRAGVISMDSDVFADGDRFSVSLTCPDDGEIPVHVVVFQNGKAYFPLGDGQRIFCGNRVPLAGAFVLDGGFETVVCASTGRHPGRDDLQRLGAAALPEKTVCTTLRPMQ